MPSEPKTGKETNSAAAASNEAIPAIPQDSTNASSGGAGPMHVGSSNSVVNNTNEYDYYCNLVKERFKAAFRHDGTEVRIKDESKAKKLRNQHWFRTSDRSLRAAMSKKPEVSCSTETNSQ